MIEIDYTGDRSEAQKLAARIAYYWQSRGWYKVRVWVEPVVEFPGNWQVRSNLKLCVTSPTS